MSRSKIVARGLRQSFKRTPRGRLIMASLLDVLFGWTHKNYSFPITKRSGQRRTPAASVTGTYVASLDCGKEFPYDWQEMRVIEGKPLNSNSLTRKATESFASK